MATKAPTPAISPVEQTWQAPEMTQTAASISVNRIQVNDLTITVVQLHDVLDGAGQRTAAREVRAMSQDALQKFWPEDKSW